MVYFPLHSFCFAARNKALMAYVTQVSSSPMPPVSNTRAPPNPQQTRPVQPRGLVPVAQAPTQVVRLQPTEPSQPALEAANFYNPVSEQPVSNFMFSSGPARPVRLFVVTSENATQLPSAPVQATQNFYSQSTNAVQGHSHQPGMYVYQSGHTPIQQQQQQQQQQATQAAYLLTQSQIPPQSHAMPQSIPTMHHPHHAYHPHAGQLCVPNAGGQVDPFNSPVLSAAQVAGPFRK